MNNQNLIKTLAYNVSFNEEMWSIHIHNEITTDTLSEVNSFFNLVLTNTEVFPTIYLSSSGGDLYSTFGIIDLMNNMKEKHHVLTNTTVLGPAFSGATLIAICGTGTRRMGKNAYMMLHDIWNEGIKNSTVTEVERQSTYLKEVQLRYLTLISEKTSFSVEELKKLVVNDIYYNSEECLKYNMIDEIL